MSLLVWLPLNGNLENQGVSAYQAIGTDLTVDNSGKIGKCYSFNGTSSKITITNFSIGNSWSYGAWVYSPTSSRGWEGAIILNTNGGDADIQLGFYTYPTGNKIQSTANGQYNSSISMTYGQWNHLFATFDGSSLKTYINGALVNTKAITNSQLVRANLTIGARCRGSSYDCFFSGKINDIRIYNHCLSAAEVHEISQGLVLHYKLDSGGTLCKTDLASWSKESGVTSATQSDGSVKIDCTAKTSSRWGIYCDIQNVLPNTPYTFSVDCKTAHVDKKWQLSVGCNPVPSGTSQFGSNRATMNSTSEFTTYTVTVTTNADTTWIRFYLAISCNSTTPEYQYAFVKNVKMIIGTSLQTTIQDSSGYGHNGSITGNIQLASNSSRYSNCMYIPSGNTDYITTNDVVGDFSSGITMNIWFKSSCTTPGSNYHEIFNIATATQNFETAIYKTGYFRGGMLINGTRYVANTDNNNLVNGQWHMITMTYDGAALKRYVDGILKSTSTIAGTVTSTSCKFLWGHYGTNTSYYAKEAYLSDTRIYVTALSADDIKSLYEMGGKIDNKQNLHIYEAIEMQPIIKLTKQGQMKAGEFQEDTATKLYKTDQIVETNNLIEL